MAQILFYNRFQLTVTPSDLHKPRSTPTPGAQNKKTAQRIAKNSCKQYVPGIRML